MRSVLVLSLVLGLVAGCIAPNGGPNAPAGARTSTNGGNMTASESRSDSVAACTSGGSGGSFCAVRTITVHGAISGISAMDVDITSFNGDVKLDPAASGSWGFVATLHARGTSEDAAKANLDNIQFAWSHQNGNEHFLSASAKRDGDGSGYSADFAVTLPTDIVYSLIGTTTNGDAELNGLATSELSLRTTNDDVQATGSVAQVSLSTTNGDVKASLRPTSSGRITATTTNGGASIGVPEGSANGYDATLHTTNGKVTIGTRDGDTSPCPTGQYYTPPCNERSFKSKDYDNRTIQQLVTITSTNGDVALTSS